MVPYSILSLMVILALLTLAAILAGLVLLLALRRRGSRSPVDILNERYARGEISKEQYDEMRRDISG